MGRISNISWTGASWNPFYAVDKKTGKRGWMCIMHGPGCLNCYAQTLNVKKIGLSFTQDDLEKVKLVLSYEGQSSIDWPLRLQKSDTIFLGSMTDWMAAFYPVEWQSLALGVMALATKQVFITLTKRWENLFSMLRQIDMLGMNRAISVPADRTFIKAIERANGHMGAYNLSESVLIVANEKTAKEPPSKTLHPLQKMARVPWLPRNVFFGISVCTVRDAEKAVVMLTNVRRKWPAIRLVISQEPALEVIDWEKLGLARNVVDWIIWGGESGEGARPAYPEDWFNLRDFGKKTGTKVFFKQTGNVLARQLGLISPKGDNINEAPLLARMDPIQETVDLTGVLV